MSRVLIFLALLLGPHVAAGAAKPLDVADGERIAFVGGTLVEREQVAGYLETMLLTRFPARNLTVRNLGCSGDTVSGEARGLCTGWAQFESADKAFERLRKLVAEFKPTLLFVNYGMTESFTGVQKLPEFTAGYNRMLDQLAAAAGGSVRFVLLSPNYHEDLGRPLPDPSAHNKSLRAFADAVRQIAGERNGTFIDLCSLTYEAAKSPAAPLTSNGIHLTPYGYWRTALALEPALGWPEPVWRVQLTASGQVAASAGATVHDVKPAGDGLSFVATDAVLPAPPPPEGSPPAVLSGAIVVPGTERSLQIAGLKPGTYRLTAAGTAVATASADAWAKGVQIGAGPQFAQVEKLRAIVVAKNFDYFNYSRPENDSYILAFRKSEQGRNAPEIPRFLLLAEAKEAQVAGLRVPVPVTYVLQLVKEAK